MADTGDETVPCHYCGADIEVPAEHSRFEAFTTHFEAEHIHGNGDPADELRHGRTDPAADTRETGS